MKEKATKCYLKTTEVLLNVDEHAGLEISVGHRTMTDSNKCLTDLKLLQSDMVSERKIKTM